jgi:tripartite-type tricarboxylate transporter receptor subunit TctC
MRTVLMLDRSLWLSVLMAAALFVCLPAQAGSHVGAGPLFEGQTIRLMATTRAGGSIDFIARTLLAQYEQSYGATGIVRNVDGLSGENALQQFLRQPAALNHWLLAQESLLTSNPLQFRKADEDVFRGLELVRSIATSHFYLVVREDEPIDSLEAFIEAARDPQALLYGTGGIGTLHHLAMQTIEQELGLRLRHIPFRSNGAAVQGLISGDVRAIMAGTSAVPLVRSGQLRVIAVTAPDPMAAFPDAPPIAHVIPGFVARNWFALFVRQGVDAEGLGHLRQAIDEVVQQSAFEAELNKRHQTRFEASQPELEQTIRQDLERFATLLLGADE